jgi:hypothetical protein
LVNGDDPGKTPYKKTCSSTDLLRQKLTLHPWEISSQENNLDKPVLVEETFGFLQLVTEISFFLLPFEHCWGWMSFYQM